MSVSAGDNRKVLFKRHSFFVVDKSGSMKDRNTPGGIWWTVVPEIFINNWPFLL
jgi:hypothetical protein